MTIKSKNKNTAAIIGDAVGKALIPVCEALDVLGDDREARCRLLRMTRSAIDSELASITYDATDDAENQQ